MVSFMKILIFNIVYQIIHKLHSSMLISPYILYGSSMKILIFFNQSCELNNKKNYDWIFCLDNNINLGIWCLNNHNMIVVEAASIVFDCNRVKYKNLWCVWFETIVLFSFDFVFLYMVD
jgi:hypothetical protein